VAVDRLDLEASKGSIFGFLGPNGAGKTTTIKILLGFLSATSGSAFLFGKSVLDPDSRASVGYLPEQPYFPKFMTAREVVRTHAALCDLTGSACKKRADECIETVGMTEFQNQRLGKLSKGQLQRIALATALAGNPKLLILDEPSSGLDPLGRKQLRELLEQLRNEGKTIFLSSHLLSETESLCDQVGIISRGKFVAHGKPSEIVEQTDNVEISTEIGNADEEFLKDLRKFGASVRSSETEKTMLITVPSPALYDILDTLRTKKANLISVQQKKETLEDAFVRLVA
jgi:ABC-2 type transport system ATP-binding protein